ncbi:4'-phosphopantetheinyl transferase superfamily protein [Brevibacterium sediminis]|nr:4'-phosphopantetheinyl transferase superfamily protein [Brevibacterium sediminis]
MDPILSDFRSLVTWTAKEAYLKMIGEGLARDMRSLRLFVNSADAWVYDEVLCSLSKGVLNWSLSGFLVASFGPSLSDASFRSISSDCFEQAFLQKRYGAENLRT